MGFRERHHQHLDFSYSIRGERNTKTIKKAGTIGGFLVHIAIASKEKLAQNRLMEEKVATADWEATLENSDCFVLKISRNFSLAKTKVIV